MEARRYTPRRMKKIDRTAPKEEHHDNDGDLARRLVRYRRRVEAEGRKRSLHLIDRAIREAGDTSGSR
jgi:hypothetical protein